MLLIGCVDSDVSKNTSAVPPHEDRRGESSPPAGTQSSKTLQKGAALESPLLLDGSVVTSQIRGESADHYRIDLPESHGLWARVQPLDAGDVAIQATDAGGQVLLYINEMWAEQPEILALAPDEPVVGLLSVTGDPGLRFSLEVKIRPSIDADQRMWANAQKFSFAGQKAADTTETSALDRIEYLEQASMIWLELEETARSVAVVEKAAQIAKTSGYQDIQLQYLSRAISTRHGLGHVAMEGHNLNERGLLLRSLGRRAEARADFDRALRIFSEASNIRYQASLMSNIGLLYQDEGNLSKAQLAHESALNLLSNLNRAGQAVHLQAAEILENLARLEMVQQRLGVAETLLDRAEEHRRRAGEQGLSSSTKLDRAWLLLLRKRPKESLEILRALEADETMSIRLRVILFDRIGSVSESVGKVGEADRAFEEAERLAREAENLDSLAGILVNGCRLGVLHPDEVSKEVTNLRCSEGLTATQAIGDPNRLPSGLYWQARNLEERGDPEAALMLYEQAASIVDGLYHRVSGLDSQIRFFEERSSLVLSRYIDLSIRLYRQTFQVAHLTRALEASERLRARGLLDFLVAAKMDPYSTADPLLNDRYAELRLRLAELDRARDLVDSSHSLEGLETSIRDTLDELDLIEGRMRAISPLCAEVRPEKPLTMKDFLRELDSDTVYLSLLLGDQESYLWLADRHGIRIRMLGPGQTLQVEALRFARALGKNNPYRAWSVGQRLSYLLFGEHGEALQGLEARRLAFVGDGPLQHLPLSALPAPGPQMTSEKRYLAQDFEVVHLPSLSTLVALRRLKKAAPTLPMAIMADPIYIQDSRFDLEPIDSDNALRIFGEIPKSPLGKLPFADVEAQKVAEYFDPASVLLMTGLDASRNNAFAADLSTYAVVHLASHGRLDPKHPALSALVFSEVNKQGQEVDGYLRLGDLQSLQWRAELVVASACETGAGGSFRFEGAQGLARGFFQIGVPRSVVSLWKIDSEATTHFMDAFYRALLVDGVPPGAALSRARRHLIENPNDRTYGPYFWAAFVFVGDWRRFDIP